MSHIKSGNTIISILMYLDLYLESRKANDGTDIKTISGYKQNIFV